MSVHRSRWSILLHLLAVTAFAALLLPAQTWTARTSGTGVYLRAAAFIDASTAFVVGGDSYASRTIKRSTDGGLTWTAQSTPGDAYAFLAVSFTDANNGTAVGDLGTIVRTGDGGATWTFQYNTAFDNYLALYAVSFASSSNGITVGKNGTILYTTNSGTNWNGPSTNPTGEYLYGVAMADVNTAVAVGAGGTIIRTTDGGANWSSVTSGTGNHLIAVDFATALIGTAVGFSGTILRTTDGGATWSDQSSGTTALRGVCFTDANNGTAVGDAGTIKRTVDGGAHWMNQTSGVSSTLTGVAFFDANVGLAVGSGGVIRGTTDGSLPVELTSFTAVRQGNGVELRWSTATELDNYGFEIQRSVFSDQGSAAESRTLTAEPDPWEVIGFVSGHGTSNIMQEYRYADRSGSVGTIHYRLRQLDRNGAFRYSAEVTVEASAVPGMFSLEQNYPNPFNPTTAIRYQLAAVGMTTLTVYDMLGREVWTLVNETKGPGSYTVPFDASSMASGVYFYTLRSGANTQSRQMSIIK